MKVVAGTYRADRAPKNEPVPAEAVPSCPGWLHAEAKREWRRIVPHLARLGLLSELDRAALAAYCEAYATWWEASRTIAEFGMTQRTETGYVAQRPEVGIRNSAWKTLRTYLGLFGMSPADRANISVEPRGDEDPADEFFSGPRLAG